MTEVTSGMGPPPAEGGCFEGGLLFDGCGHRGQDEISAYSYAPNRLGIVKKKQGYFVAEFLSKHSAPQFGLPVWDAVREPAICGDIEEARMLTHNFASDDNSDY